MKYLQNEARKQTSVKEVTLQFSMIFHIRQKIKREFSSHTPFNEWLKHFTTLEACRLDSQWHTFPKWAINIWTNVPKLEEHFKIFF